MTSVTDGPPGDIPDLSGLFMRGWTGKRDNDTDIDDRRPVHDHGAAGFHVASYQGDEFARHTHGRGESISCAIDTTSRQFEHAHGGDNPGSDQDVYRGGRETRPKNVYVLYAFYAGRPGA